MKDERQKFIRIKVSDICEALTSDNSWQAFDLLSNQEVIIRANNDPDAPSTGLEDLHKFKRYIKRP